MAITQGALKSLLSQERLAKFGMKEVIDNFVDGNTFQNMLEIPDKAMQTFYEIALSYFENKQFEEASDCFLFLAALNPLESNLWIRSGNAEQALGRYEEALEAYSMAMLSNADDPFPHYYSAEIYHELGSYAQAKECLHVCDLLIDENREFLPLKEHVKHLQERVRKHT